MKPRSALALALIACAPALLLLDIACSNGAHAPPAPTLPSASQPLIIGVTLGLTGSLGGTASPVKNATRVAEQQINALGGLFGRPVEFRVVDDTSDEDAVVRRAVTGLLDQGAIAILGPVGSQQVVATQSVVAARHVIQLSSSATSPELSAKLGITDRYFFRTVPPDDLQGKAVVQFALRGPAGRRDGGASAGCKRMAVVHLDNAYGNSMAQVIAAYLPTKGGSVVVDISIPSKRIDNYQEQANLLASKAPDCQALIAYEDTGAAFLTDLKKVTLPAGNFTIGTDGVYTQGFLDNGQTGAVVENVYGTNADTNPDTPEFHEFEKLYNTSFSQVPEAYTANQFDAAMLAILAIQKAGPAADGVKIRDALYSVSRMGQTFTPSQLGEAIQAVQNGVDIDYKGASGNVDLDETGNVVGDFIIWKVVNAAFVTIDHIKATDLQ